jgi:hypothetical protein
MIHQNSSWRLRTVQLAFVLLWLSGLRVAAQTAPVYPAWWANQGVLSGTVARDYAVVNQGEVKNIAVGAINELNEHFAQFGGAGNALNELAVSLTATSAQTSDYAAVNLGQLKALAHPFYDRLLSLGYALGPLTSGTYPWATSGLAPSDYAAGNIGQLKYLFSFDLSYSSTGDGIPDWWVEKYFSGESISATADPTGDGLTNYQNFEDGTDPTSQDNPAVGLEVNIIVQ